MQTLAVVPLAENNEQCQQASDPRTLVTSIVACFTQIPPQEISVTRETAASRHLKNTISKLFQQYISNVSGPMSFTLFFQELSVHAKNSQQHSKESQWLDQLLSIVFADSANDHFLCSWLFERNENIFLHLILGALLSCNSFFWLYFFKSVNNAR